MGQVGLPQDNGNKQISNKPSMGQLQMEDFPEFSKLHKFVRQVKNITLRPPETPSSSWTQQFYDVTM